MWLLSIKLNQKFVDFNNVFQKKTLKVDSLVNIVSRSWLFWAIVLQCLFQKSKRISDVVATVVSS